jgi:tRNA C32,U32 (ribose-2'-O)-methylase TrmJ
VVVVDPRCDPRSNEVDVTSCSSQVLQSMRVMPTLAAALADCTGWLAAAATVLLRR